MGVRRTKKKMIKRYSDHAANERTYLAWIRTALAIMAFGFLIEKFELFVSFSLGKASGNEKHLQASLSAEIVGIVLLLVGFLIIVSATARFFMYKKSIESEELLPYSVKKTNIVLSALLILLGLFILVYIGHVIAN